jgi:hypothetical protein
MLNYSAELADYLSGLTDGYMEFFIQICYGKHGYDHDTIAGLVRED